MPGVYPRHEHGPLNFTATAVITGGQLVTPDDANPGGIKPAGASDTAILGVAHTDARPYVEAEHYPTTAYGAESMDVSVPGDIVAVGFQGVYELEASGAIAFGALVEPAAGGLVATKGTGQTVGRCVQAEGIASGERGMILLMLLGTA